MQRAHACAREAHLAERLGEGGDKLDLDESHGFVHTVLLKPYWNIDSGL